MWTQSKYGTTAQVIPCSRSDGTAVPAGRARGHCGDLLSPSRRRVYVVSTEEEHDVIAATPPTFTPDDLDIRIIELLAQDNGGAFVDGIVGGPPSTISFGPCLSASQQFKIVYGLLDAAGVVEYLTGKTASKKQRTDIVRRWMQGACD